MKKRWGLLLPILTLIICGCAKGQTFEVYDLNVTPLKSEEIINGKNVYVDPLYTTVSLRVFDRTTKDDIFNIFENSIHHSHRLFDATREYQDEQGHKVVGLKAINDSYGSGESLIVDSALFELLKMSIQISELTNGAFNPTLGTLISTWEKDEAGQARFTPFASENVDPSEASIQDSLTCVVKTNELKNVLELDEVKHSVTFHEYAGCTSQVVLNLGGIAKGYALDQAKDAILAKYPTSVFALDSGTSSITLQGVNPTPESENRPAEFLGKWVIEIVDANSNWLTKSGIAVITLDGNSSISSSGDYEKSFINSAGIRRHHILNPLTGYSENYWRVVSVNANANSAIADALTTALFNISSLTEINSIVGAINTYYGLDIALLLEAPSSEEGKVKVYANSLFHSQIDSSRTSYAKMEGEVINVF